MNTLSRREFLAVSALSGLTLISPGNRPSITPLEDVEPDSAAKQQFQPFADHIRQTMAETGIVGISTALIRDRKVVYTDGFGLADMRTGARMTPKSVMSMASIAKSFTAASIMQLIERGLIQSIDDPFTKYVPYFIMEDPRYAQVTLRHLLSHTSGIIPLAEVDFFGEFMEPEYDEGAAERLVRSLATGVALRQDPGGPDFLYSDVGYDILADLVHKVSGLNFEEFVRRNILKPLRMQESSFLLSEVKRQRLVAAHITLADGSVGVWDWVVPYDRKHAPSSCLHTSAEEYANWLICNMNRGEFKGRRILSTQNHSSLWNVLYPWSPSEFGGYCWGCEAFDYYGSLGVGYGGGQPGVQTIGVQCPDLGLGVAVLGNTFGSFTDDWIPWIVGDLAFWALDWMYSGVEPASAAKSTDVQRLHHVPHTLNRHTLLPIVEG